MLTALVLVFVLTYLAIALEHPLDLHKSASALAGAGLMWTIYACLDPDTGHVLHALDHTVTGAAQIVFFLMGAMAIVEVIDAHHGFDVLTRRIRTHRAGVLLWLVGGVTFVLSAVLDNLTTTLVMIALLRKRLHVTARADVQRLYAYLRARHYAPAAWQVAPLASCRMFGLDDELARDLDERQVARELPPLLRGYLRAGAVICGPPALDADFGTADVLVLLPMEQMARRYRQHYTTGAWQ